MGIEAIKETYEERDIDHQEDSLSADLAAAWAESEEEVHDEQDESTESASSESKPEGSIDQPAESDPDVHPEPVSGKQKPDDGAKKGDNDNEKPPVGLSPAAREAWKETPKAMRAEIAKREADFAKGIQQYAENAKRAQGMDAVLQPYQQYLAMNGGPGKTIQTLLQTGASLQMGSPTQKAQMVAQLINQFGVDIQALDQLLVGQTPKEKPENQFNQILDQRLAPLQQQLSEYQRREQAMQQQEQGKIVSEIDGFAAEHEFYMDVRGDMADILDMAANRGQPMTLKQAYEKACVLHPEISNILQSRQKAPTPQQRRAASSISGSPSGTDGGSAADSIRAAIEDAWNSSGRD